MSGSMPSLKQTSCSSRIERLQASIVENNLPPLLLSKPTDISYFTGFQFLLSEEREAFLLVDKDHVILWYASFSPLPTDIPCIAIPMRGINELNQKLLDLQLTALAIDPSALTLAEYRIIEKTSIPITELDRKIIWQQRMQKDSEEQAKIIKACQIATQIVTLSFPLLKQGITEQEFAFLLDTKIREHHAIPAFPTIVAFGAHTALPHHQPTDTMLQPESAILIDFGAQYQSYCSDMTRSWWFGTKPPTEYQTIQSAVDRAYQAGVEAINQSLTAQQLDSVVRNSLESAGFGKNFIHTTGHGLGLEIHEPPSISSSNPQELMPNMAITIEPGVYLPDEFGYRFENTVLLTSANPLIATQTE